MVELAGSEILTLELARELGRRDYEVTVFAHALGDPIARLARERGVAVTNEPRSLQGVDLAWIHHQVVPDALLACLSASHPLVVFEHLSPSEPLELPFLADVEARLADVIVANSAETAAALPGFGIDGDLPVVVLGNPAPDEFWQAPRSRPHELRRLLLVSNHLPAEVDAASALLQARGIEVTHIGWPDRRVPVTPEEIAAADAVLTIGKTVQYALAVGRPVFCYDRHGGPGWLSAANLEVARRHNFSGRPFAAMDAGEIATALVEGHAQAAREIDALREAVSDLTWTRGLDQVFAAAAASRVKGDLSEPERRRLNAWFALAARSARAHHDLVAVHREAAALAQERLVLQRELRTLHDSHSMRLTAPLRSSLVALRGVQESRRRRAARLGRPALVPEVVRLDSLPALAWLCRVSDDSARLLVGPQVEVGAGGISEGAWVGRFGHAGLKASRAVFGSGVVFERDGLLFVPPSHPFEALHVLRDLKSGVYWVSNSMCFAVSQIPDPHFIRFCRALDAGLREVGDVATAAGVDKAATEIFSSSGYRLSRHPYFRLRTDGPGGPTPVPDATTRPFADYRTYREFLSRSLAELFANAADPGRTQRFDPVVTVSSGYDSPAVAALAAENGCRRAVTLGVIVTGTNDSGAAIAAKLGLDVKVHRHIMGDRVDHLRVDFGPELAARTTEFLATEGVGDDVAFLPFEPDLRGGLLLTGGGGDSAWGIDSLGDPGLTVSNAFCRSITEFRLRVGFAHAPVPFMGRRTADSIAAISRSAEMTPFSVGGAYDRPIARRICEEAGLARGDFGVEKAATAPLPTNRAALFVDAMTAIRERYAAALPGRCR